MTVWKFPLRWGEVSVSMPRHAKVVLVGKDPASDYPALWAVVDPEAERETRTFAVVGTGHAVPESSYHLGSLIELPFVWHVFETSEKQVLAQMLGALSL